MNRTTRCLVAALIALAAALVTSTVFAQAKAPYRIGAIFDVTGPAAPLGTPERDTVKMIQEQINKKGGINGHPVEFIIYDNGSENTACYNMVKKLIESHKVKAIIGPSQTGTTMAVADLCQKSGIPLLSCAAGRPITDPVKSYVFKTAQSDVFAVAKVIDYLKAKRIKNIAFINVSNAFGASGREQMEKQAVAAGLNITTKEAFGDKDTDMTPQLTHINGARPQAVVCWGTNPGPAIVARNMKQLGMRMPLIMSHGVANKKFIELAGDAAEGVILPAGRLVVADHISRRDRQKGAVSDFAVQFRKEYGRDADSFGGYAWDAAYLVMDAMRKVGDDPSRIRSEIEKRRKYAGVSGVFNFSPAEHNGLTKDAFVMVRVAGGNWAPAK